MSVSIKGVGSFLPDRSVSNTELFGEKMGKFAERKIGIRNRRIVADDDDIITISCKASRDAVEDAKISLQDVDMIISIASPHMMCPSNSGLIQQELGISECQIMDIPMYCPAFPIGVNVASNAITLGQCKNAIIVGAEVSSRNVPKDDLRVALYFADGAGAVVVSKSQDKGILSYFSGAWLGNKEVMSVNVGTRYGIEYRAKDYVGTMDTAGVFQFAIKAFPDAVKEALALAGLTVDDVDLVIPHQANLRIIEKGMESLGLGMDKTIITLVDYGNTASASIPISLHEAVKQGVLEKGNIVVLVGFGASLAYSALVLEW